MVPSHTSTTPKTHDSLGLPTYCQATSPLRRISDMLTHYQIKSVYRKDSNERLSSNELEQLLQPALSRERQNKSIQRHNATHWTKVHMYEEARKAAQEKSGRGVYDAYVLDISGSVTTIHVPKLGFTLRISKLSPPQISVDSWIRIRADTKEPLYNSALLQFEQTF